MKENCDHRGIAVSSVFFDAGHAVIASLKQVLGLYFSVLLLEWSERNIHGTPIHCCYRTKFPP